MKPLQPRSGTLHFRLTRNPRRLIAVPAQVLLLATAWIGLGCGPRPEQMAPGKFPEKIVFVRTADDIVDAGVLFSPPQESAKPTAVIWVHGWGVNFYSPTYVAIGRALAEQGYTCIAGNTRMHDIGNVAGYRWGKRIRGGGYWGVASEEVRDLAAWVDFAEQQGFKQVVLVGHSAGWAAVRAYQYEQQDPRVVGMVLASGMVWGEKPAQDPELLAEATRLVEEGRGDDLIRLPNRSFPSFISAATHLDIQNTPPEMRDFFGVKISNPGITRIHCPLLAFFGTDGDVGSEADLELLKSSALRQSNHPPRVDTVMIRDADHMYTGEETQVAQTLSKWIGTLEPPKSGEK